MSTHPISDRQKILEYKLSGMNENSKNINVIAELICRRLYEKAFNINLDLPYGHPHNMIQYKDEEELKKYVMDEIEFWMSLRDKYKVKQEHLYIAIVSWADQQIEARIKLLIDKSPTSFLNKKWKSTEDFLKTMNIYGEK